ncbi:MAG: MMPL family transporter, partial [Planctomycetota bacterium]
MASLLVRWHLGLLAVAIAVALIGLPVSRNLNLDWSVEGMFPQDDPTVEAYRHLQERFGAKDICLAVYYDPELWDAPGAGLKRLGEISEGLAQVEGIQAVLSLSELNRVLKTVRGPMRLFGNQDGSPLLDSNDKLAQSLAQVFEGYTHRPETNYVAMACMLETVGNESLPGPSDHEATLQRISDFMKQIPSPATQGMVTGEPVLVAEGFKMVQRDGVRLGITCSVIVSLVLLLCFRSLRWTLIPMAVVHWALIATQASLVWLAMDLTMISSTLTSIVTVIGVATSIHLLLRFQEERRKGIERKAALESTLRVLLKPIFFACVTDAVGFCALLFANVGPVRDFGLMMAMGSMAVFFAILLVVPGLALLGPWDTDP